MKAVFFTLTLLSLRLFTCAQTLNVVKKESGDEISFTFMKEINTAYYVIEASDDTLNYEVICRIKLPQEYSRQPRSYRYTLYNTGYLYYIVKQIDMSGSCVVQLQNKAASDRSPVTGPGLIAEGPAPEQ